MTDRNPRIVRLVADPYPPYQFEEAGEVKGVDHDIVREAFRASGAETATRLLPWRECMKEMESKGADGVFQIVKTPERERLFLFSETLRKAKTVLYALKPRSTIHGRRIFTPEQVKRCTVGVLAGYSYDPSIDSLKPPNKIEVEDHTQLILGLRGGKFELALMDQGVAEYQIAKHGIDDIEKVMGYIIERELYVAFQREQPELVGVFNKGLFRIRQSGLYDTLFTKYGIPN